MEGGRERGTERWMIQDEDAAVILLGERVSCRAGKEGREEEECCN